MKKLKIIILFILGLCLPEITTAQAGEMDEKAWQNQSKSVAKEFTNQARIMRVADLEGAKEYLRARLETCKDLSRPGPCQTILNFTLGYYYQLDAQDRSDSQLELLQTAKLYYEQALEIYPNNEKVLTNYRFVQRDMGDTEGLINTAQKLTKIFPEQKDEYYREIGDLLVLDSNYSAACKYYLQAYQENQTEPLNCERLVNHYLKTGTNCFGTAVFKFAYECNEYGLTNLALDVVEQDIKTQLKGDQPYFDGLVHLINLMAENGWIDAVRLQRIFGENETSWPADVREINTLFAGKAPNLQYLHHWNSKNRIMESPLTGLVSPLTVATKVVYSKAKDNIYQKGGLRNAVLLLESVVNLYYSNYDMDELIATDPTTFFNAAGDLASLYHKYKNQFDQDGNKLKRLTNYLFRVKNRSYSKGDIKQIRNFHITLGNIFYEQQKISGGGAANAEFQLRNALDEDRLGPIVNPVLHKMLGDVYVMRSDPKRASQSYMESIQDHMNLDNLAKAESLHREIVAKRLTTNNTEEDQKMKALARLIKLRNYWEGDHKEITNLDSTRFTQQIQRMEKEYTSFDLLDKKFVDAQFFKGYTDIAIRIPKTQANYRQQLNSKALQLSKDQTSFSTIKDYNRIQNIKSSFEFTSTSPTKARTIQTQTKYDRNTKKDPIEFKTFDIINLGLEVKVPIILYDVSEEITKYYRAEGITKSTPTIELENNRINVRTLNLEQPRRN